MQKYMPSSQFNCYLIIITITIVDRKSTRLNSSHLGISYAVFCLKKKSTRLNSSHLGISYAGFCLKTKRHAGRNAPGSKQTATRTRLTNGPGADSSASSGHRSLV